MPRNDAKEDRRITKTKQNLKKTLWQLLSEENFDKITVKEICDRAMTSRITFYNYYSDKYALLEAIFEDMNEELTKHYEMLQQHNPDDDAIIAFENLLDCFLGAEQEIRGIASNVNLQRNSVLVYPYYRFLVDNTTKVINHYADQLKPRYDPERISNFVVLGLFGYLHRSDIHSTAEQESVQQSAHTILRDLLNSNVFLQH